MAASLSQEEMKAVLDCESIDGDLEFMLTVSCAKGTGGCLGRALPGKGGRACREPPTLPPHMGNND